MPASKETIEVGDIGADAIAVGAGAMGAGAVGALAVGAIAIGAIAIGAVAIGRIVIVDAVVARLRAETVELGTLRVDRLEIAGQPWPPTTATQGTAATQATTGEPAADRPGLG